MAMSSVHTLAVKCDEVWNQRLYISDRPTVAEHATGVQRPPSAVLALYAADHDHMRVQLRVARA